MKNKNNLIIILAVTLTAVAVIVIVLLTGFASSGSGTSGSGFSEIVSAEESSAPESFKASSESGSVSETASVPEVSSAPIVDDVGQRIASSAVSLIGTPFLENGDTPEGFDNSGFIYYVLRENGFIACPRTTDAQSKMGAVISRDELRVGDLVFFGNNGSGLADFGGIYVGDGKMICCQMPGTTVKEVDITTDYYMENFFGGVSVS